MNDSDASALDKLREERATLQERLRLLEQATADGPGEGPLTESPESLRGQLAQVDRLIAEQEQGR